MGMNYYCRRIPEKEDKKKLYEFIETFPNKDELLKMADENRLEELKYLFNDAEYEFPHIYEEIRKKVHLGKNSYGWQFLWASNPDFYENTLESIKKFATQPGWEIVNEENEVFTWPEFIERIGNKLYKTDDLWDLPSYYEQERKEGKRYYQFGIDTEYTTEEGLRFCRDAEFS